MALIQDSRLGDGYALRQTDINEKVVGVTSSTGSSQLPSGTTAERDPAPINGMIRFNTDTNRFEGYINGGWLALSFGAEGGGADQVFLETDNTVTTSYNINTNKNAFTTGPITVNDGVTITVPDGSRYVVI